MRGVAEAKRGRGEYMNSPFVIRTPPCPFGASPLINEGGKRLVLIDSTNCNLNIYAHL